MWYISAVPSFALVDSGQQRSKGVGALMLCVGLRGSQPHVTEKETKGGTVSIILEVL